MANHHPPIPLFSMGNKAKRPVPTIDFKAHKKQIIISLPLTTPSGKVRVKRPVAGCASNPVACRSVPIEKNDYLEWQISYDTDTHIKPSALRTVKFQKTKTKARYGYELVWLLYQAKKRNILPSARYKNLRKLVFGKMISGIEESEKIQMHSDLGAKTTATEHGFVRHYLHTPNYLLAAKSYSIELKIAHKQRATGNQAMIYVHVPLNRCQSNTKKTPLIGRCAIKREKANYIIDASCVDLICNTIVAFALASVAHRNDLQKILSSNKIFAL
jgi:R.Pab1 restriction endonuclease